LNGDGLPDMVRRDGSQILVRYGLGHDFAPEVVAGTIAAELLGPTDDFEGYFDDIPLLDRVLANSRDALARDTTITEHSTKSVNLIIAGGSVTTRKTSTRTTRQLADINGDGLPDLLMKKHGQPIRVQLNLGGRFSDPAIEWATPAWTGRQRGGSTLPYGLALSGAASAPESLGLPGPAVLAGTRSQEGRRFARSHSVPIRPGRLSLGGSQWARTDTDTYELA